MRSPAVVLALVVLLALVGCGNVEQDRIVGRWQDVGGNAWSEYFPDGTAIINTGSVSLNVKWQRLEDGRLKVETTVSGITTAAVYRVEIRGDDLTFTDSDGETQHYLRAGNE